MVNIDYIMELLDWNNSVNNQNRGLELAKDIKCISVFIQPGSPYGKNVWGNCAKVLSRKTDTELMPYLFNLMEWLQDMNWPGAACIHNRLLQYKDNAAFDAVFSFCIKRAKMLNDEEWLNNLSMVKKTKEKTD